MKKTELETAVFDKSGTLVAVTKDFVNCCHALSAEDLRAIKSFYDMSGIENVCIAGKVIIFKGFSSVCEGGAPQVALVWREEQPDHTIPLLFTATMDFPWLEGQALFRDLSDHLARLGICLTPHIDRPMRAYIGKDSPGEPALENRCLAVVPNDVVLDLEEGALMTRTPGNLAIYTI